MPFTAEIGIASLIINLIKESDAYIISRPVCFDNADRNSRMRRYYISFAGYKAFQTRYVGRDQVNVKTFTFGKTNEYDV